METWWFLVVAAFFLFMTIREASRTYPSSPLGRKQNRAHQVDYIAYVVDLNTRYTLDDLESVFMEPFITALAPKGVSSGQDVECHLYDSDNNRVEVLSDDEEPNGASIDFWAPEATDEFEAECVRVLESLGAPKGSQLVAPEFERYTPFGVTEGMVVYIDTTGLPTQVYDRCSVDAVLVRFPELFGDRGEVVNFWEGPKETAVYCYGPSFQAVADAIAPFVAEYPLLEGCRIEQIA